MNLLLGQILNGIATGMLYALMGLGLSLITGILNIPNFAHGALFAVGAYLTVTVINAVGNFWIALAVAPLGVAVLGLVIEYAGIRRLYAAGHDYQLLFTFGLSLILAETIILVWGPVGISQLPPAALRGGVDLGFTFYPKYRLFVMAAAGLLVIGTWLFLEKTRYGAIMRAGIENKEMVSLLGIDIHRLFTVAFALGAWLAGIAGALTAPIRGLSPSSPPWWRCRSSCVRRSRRRSGSSRSSASAATCCSALPGCSPSASRLSSARRRTRRDGCSNTTASTSSSRSPPGRAWARCRRSSSVISACSAPASTSSCSHSRSTSSSTSSPTSGPASPAARTACPGSRGRRCWGSIFRARSRTTSSCRCCSSSRSGP